MTWENDFEPIFQNDLSTLAREVFETTDEEYDTGVLDAKGNPIVRYVIRNPIGFRAVIEEE